MTVAVLGVPAARSRQEVVELIGFIGQAGEELERIADDLERQVVQAKARADEASQPNKAVVAEDQENDGHDGQAEDDRSDHDDEEVPVVSHGALYPPLAR